MNLNFCNYNKPSQPIYRKIGDICLFAIPLYTPIILSLPITDNVKLIVTAITSIVLATVKIISKFSVDSNYMGSVEVKDLVNDTRTGNTVIT